MKFPELRGQTAIVTGGTSGIGKSIATTLSESGVNVAAASRTKSKVASVAEDLQSDVACQADVRVRSDVRELFEQTTEEYGGVNILINSAGIFFDESPVEDLTRDAWSNIIETNLFGSFVTSQLFPSYSNGENQVIVNISSIAGEIPLEGLTTYTSTKFGVNGLTKSLAIEYAEEGIRVNAVAPGYTKTAQNRERLERADVKGEIEKKTPLGRYAGVEEVAQAVLFLVSPSSGFITGEVLTVDGGYSLTNY
jgi:NAD(P)-dependent dehydrogenase (short-subunit alcohol dehydrogenase family)